MSLLTLFSKLSLYMFLSIPIIAEASDLTNMFKRPVYSRVYNDEQYALADTNRADGNRVNISQVATALAGLQPSYVSSTLYLGFNMSLTSSMISDFNTLRSAVPNAKFDIELSLDPDSMNGRQVYTSAAELVVYMKQLNSQLRLDGWWFDFYSNAQKTHPDYVAAAIAFAHSNNQTVGGNVFGDVIPPGSDAVSVVDNPDNSTSFGFAPSAKEIAALHQNSSSTIILGHQQSNPQNGNSTVSCVYMYDWSPQMRASYQDFWYSQQAVNNFTYMYPLFYPLCPGAFSFNPLSDIDNGTSLYQHIQKLAIGTVNGTGSTSTSGPTKESFARTNAAVPAKKYVLLVSFAIVVIFRG